MASKDEAQEKLRKQMEQAKLRSKAPNVGTSKAMTPKPATKKGAFARFLEGGGKMQPMPAKRGDKGMMGKKRYL